MGSWCVGDQDQDRKNKKIAERENDENQMFYVLDVSLSFLDFDVGRGIFFA